MKQRKRRISLILGLTMLVSLISPAVYAVPAENEAGGVMTGSSYEEGLCEHHTVHDKDCGYEPADEGHPCSHVKDGEHDKSCYELICGYKEGELEEADASDSDAPRPHEHDDSCYELDCPHLDGKHDEACGYEAPTEGQTCGFTCEICGKDDEAGGGQDAEDEASKPQNGIDDPAAEETDTDKGENADVQEDKSESCICEIRCTEDNINGDCPVCSSEDAELEAVCLGDATRKKAPRANQYTVMFKDDDPDPENGITTYKVTELNPGGRDHINRNVQIDGNVVFDLRGAENNTSNNDSGHLGLRVMNPNSQITIIGDPVEEYYMKIDLPNAFVSGPNPHICYAADIVLEDV